MRIVLYAVGSPHACEVAESARRLGIVIAAAVRNHESPVPEDIGPVVSVDHLAPDLLSIPFVVPLTTPGHRHTATREASLRGFTTLATLVDPTAIVASTARMAPGTYVNAGAIVSAGVQIGASCSLNRGCSIGHHTVLDEFASIGPGAVTGGACRIGRGAFLGVGCVVAPQTTIGANAVVGAGAVVIAEVPDGAVVVGNPARVIRHGAGYADVGVP